MNENHNPLPTSATPPSPSSTPNTPAADYTPPLQVPHYNTAQGGNIEHYTDNGDQNAAAAIYLCFFLSPLAPVALFLSLSAKKKAKASGAPITFATTAVIISSIMTAIMTLTVLLIIVAITMAATNGIQQRARDAARQQSDAMQKKLDDEQKRYY